MTTWRVCVSACLPACMYAFEIVDSKQNIHTHRERDSQQFRHATELENKNKTSCMWYKCELSWALRQQTADQKQNKNNSNVKRHSELASGWDHKSRDNDVIHTGEIRADDGLRLSWSSKIDRVREAERCCLATRIGVECCLVGYCPNRAAIYPSVRSRSFSLFRSTMS